MRDQECAKRGEDCWLRGLPTPHSDWTLSREPQAATLASPGRSPTASSDVAFGCFSAATNLAAAVQRLG